MRKIMDIEDKVRCMIEAKETNIYHKIIAEVESKIINTALIHFYGNQSQACRVMGINRGTIKKKLIKNKKTM
jgi:DNA-binding protein Fis